MRATVEFITSGDVVLANVSGLVDEHFTGFKNLPPTVKTLIINVAEMTRMTSFGVRQWLKGIDGLPKSIADLYLLGCPTFFVDQLNMVLNFGGSAQILTVQAPYTCPSCGVESGEIIDVLKERATLVRGGVSDKECSRCSAKLEFDETPESYFAFATNYAASFIQPDAAQLLSAQGLYTAFETAIEKPPRIIKLVRGSVTYFRIIGTIGALFRARPLLVGAEGEVVIDLAEIDRFDKAGQHEWRRLLKSLSQQVPAITLVDVTEAYVQTAGDSFGIARNISVWSVSVPYRCGDCGRKTSETLELANADWPLRFDERVCATCGGSTRCEIHAQALQPIQKAGTSTPPASAKLIQQREEVLSRALTDATSSNNSNRMSSLNIDDTILGKYRIVRRLTSGGMAEVFLAKQVGIGGFEKPVALKRIQRHLLETHLGIDMFLNEAKIAGRLTHPNIVQVLDVGEESGVLYLAMEYVHGRDLREVIKKLRSNNSMMPLGEACFIVQQIANALHHAYWSTDMAGNRLSVVHRDVSPHNIMLGYDGTVKLLDFGVAMSAVTEQSEALIVGKWLYMSPEHTTNQQIDHTSDLFSLGVILYLLCTGHVPFTGQDPKAIVKKIRAGQYTPLQEHVPDAPPSLAALCARLLSPRPEDRPQTGQEVAAAIADVMRNNSLEVANKDISYFVGALLPEEPVEVSRPSVTMTEETSIPRKVAVGSGPQQDVDENSRSIRPSSASIPVMPTAPTDATGRRRSSKRSTLSPPLPNAPQKANIILWVIIIVALLALAAIATRLVIAAM